MCAIASMSKIKSTPHKVLMFGAGEETLKLLTLSGKVLGSTHIDFEEDES
jgi:hypothetical protein